MTAVRDDDFDMQLDELRDELRRNHSEYLAQLSATFTELSKTTGRIEQRLDKLEKQIVGNGGPEAVLSRLRQLEHDNNNQDKTILIIDHKLDQIDSCVSRLEVQQQKWRNIAIGVGISWPVLIGLMIYIAAVILPDVLAH